MEPCFCQQCISVLLIGNLMYSLTSLVRWSDGHELDRVRVVVLWHAADLMTGQRLGRRKGCGDGFRRPVDRPPSWLI